MGWSLGCQPFKEPELLDRFLLAAGKSLCLATAYERKCRFILRIMDIVQHYEDTGDSSASLKLAMTLKDKMLAQTVKGMSCYSVLSESEVALLERAKDARNFIAQESTATGLVNSASREVIMSLYDQLRQEVEALVAGDNIVSRMVYEIEEKEPAPKYIYEAYSSKITDWVFGDSMPRE